MANLRRSPIASGLLIFATLMACSVFGGGSDPIDDLRGFIESEVADPSRRTRMLAAADRLDAQIRAYNDVSRSLGTEMRELNRDYDASQRQFEELFFRQNAARGKARDELLHTALQLRDLATAEEWEAISALQIRAYRERISFVQSSEEEKSS